MRIAIFTLSLAIALGSVAGVSLAAPVCGDVNRSNTVTASDALAVLRAAVGQDVGLICPLLGAVPQTGQTFDHGPGSDGVLRPGIGRFLTANGDGTVTDDTTGLMWQLHDDADHAPRLYSWSAENDDMNGTLVTGLLEDLNEGEGFAGHNDWRIPSILELFSIVNYDRKQPSVSPEFHADCEESCALGSCACTAIDCYWSSSTYQFAPSQAWTVNFNAGEAQGSGKTTFCFARAVRDAS